MLNVLRNLIAYLLLAVIVMTAFTSLMLRLLTPMLSEYRTDIEQWASQLIEQPISIKSIDARMVGFSPQLNLAGVELLDQNRQRPIAQFSGLSIHFGMLSSLISGNITLDHIELHGLDISLIRDVDGSISVNGLGGIKRESGGESQKRPSGGGFGVWLLQQGKVSLHNSHIRWFDKGSQRNLDFPEVSVIIQNDGNHHIVNGLLELPEEIGGEIEVDLNLTGNIFDSKSWHGDLYLRGEMLNGKSILEGVALKQWQLNQGELNGELWGEIIAGKLSQMQGRLAAKAIELEYMERRLPLSRFDSHALIKRVDSGWQLQFSRLNFDGALRGKLPHYLQLKQERGGWRVALDQLNLDALPPFISMVKPELLDKSAQFGGHLRSVDLYFGKTLEMFRATMDQVKVSGLIGLPAVSGLTGQIDLSDGGVSLAVNSPALELTLSKIFAQKLPSLAVEGVLSASWDEERWQLWSHQLQLQNDDLKLTIAANLQSQFKQSKGSRQKPHVAITADINVAAVNRLKHYIPDRILNAGTSNWLKKAFHSGDIKGGKLLIYGRGAGIVAHSKGGRMEIALNPKGVDLQFQKDWPQIKSIDAELRFSGRKMTIHSSKGGVLSSGSVDDVVVKIDDFKVPVLEVDGMARFDAMDGIRYVSMSPLKEILGNLGESLVATGEQELKLHLAIPLGARARNSGKGVSVEGKLNFKKVLLNIEDSVKINEISGVLAFNQSGVKRSTVKARIFDSPLNISIFKRRQGVQQSTFIKTSGRVDPQKILANVDMPWAREITGETAWNGVVEFDHTKKITLLNIDSNLKGVESRLPHPANKASDDALRLDLKYQFSGKVRRQIDVSLGKRLSAQLKFPKGSGAIRDIHIHLGGDRLKQLKDSGLLFTGRLSQLDVGGWLKLLPDRASMQGKGGFDLPIRIDMQRLHILDKSGISSGLEKAKGGILPSSIPPLEVVVNALKYGALQLGGVVLVTGTSKTGLTIKKLVVSDGNHRLVANGTWKKSSGTRLNLKLTAKDTGKMLKAHRFDTPMEKGKLTAKGTLRWPNSPVDFDLGKIKGSFSINIKEGIISDIDTEAGQLLGLFNVRKLLNRIFLDFSDIKEKALSYKELAGSFRIARGNLTTDNFRLGSLQADMLMKGRTGLTKRDYDLHLSVIPQISDAVPVAGTLVFGPQVAVALLAFRKLFGKEFDKGAMQQYRITGSWDKPSVKKIEVKMVDNNDE